MTAESMFNSYVQFLSFRRLYTTWFLKLWYMYHYWYANHCSLFIGTQPF